MDTSQDVMDASSITGLLNNNSCDLMDPGLSPTHEDEYQGYHQLQASSSPLRTSPRSRPGRRRAVSHISHIRPIQYHRDERPLAIYCINNVDDSGSPRTPNSVSFPVSRDGRSPPRRSPNRSRTATSSPRLGTSDVNICRKVKSGADGGLRSKKMAARSGATLSPKRKRGPVAGVGKLMRTVKSFVVPSSSAKENDTGRRVLAEYVFKGTGRMSRAPGCSQDGQYFPLPRTPTSVDMTINDPSFNLSDDDNDHIYVDDRTDPLEASPSTLSFPASLFMSNSLDIDESGNTERASNPTERRTTARGGGSLNKLIRVLGPEVRDILEAPILNICAQ